MSSDDERISYLAGDPAGDLDDSSRAELDEFRALLADPSVWSDPAPDLEDRIVSAIAVEAQPSGNVVNLSDARRRRSGRVLAAVAAVAAVAVAFVAFAVVPRAPPAGGAPGPSPRKYGWGTG